MFKYCDLGIVCPPLLKILVTRLVFQRGTRLFGLADSVLSFRSGRFGLGTFRSGYEILQKSYMFTF